MGLDDLRKQVIERQRAANRKVNRLRNKGVQIVGTGHDVRRDIGNVGKYNARQLQAYLGQLNSFIDRSNSFVPGSQGTPIRRSVWNEYKRAERAYNRKAEEHYSGVQGTFVPQAGMTIVQFDTSVRPNTVRARGGVNRPLEPQRFDSFEIANEKRLADLTKRLQSKSRQEYLPAQIRKQRRTLNKAVQDFGDPELNALAKSLTDEQFDILFNYTDAPRDMFEGYHFLKLLATGKADKAQASIHEDSAYETRQWLEWASKLPTRGNRKNR